MKITIHRGFEQIGGCITEIRSKKGSKILIDLGHNLPGVNQEDELDKDENLQRLLDGVDAIFYTHNHGDHLGFYEKVPDGIHQYMGKVATEVQSIYQKHLKKNAEFLTENVIDSEIDEEAIDRKIEKLKQFTPYVADETIHEGKFNDIEVIPYYVNHSAADAYMLVIKCDDKVVLHSGDFRGNGLWDNDLTNFLHTHIDKYHIDCLICEGTNLNRGENTNSDYSSILKDFLPDKNSQSGPRMYSESEEKKMAGLFQSIMKEKKNVFLLCSSTNFDRLNTFYGAATNMKRTFICDIYQKSLFEALARQHYIYGNYRFKDTELFSLKTMDDIINKSKNGICGVIRTNGSFDKWMDALAKRLDPEDTVMVYSQYLGYVAKGSSAFSKSTYDFLRRHRNQWEIRYAHVSGHVLPEDLASFCNTVNPKSAIIPIHHDNDADFLKLDITESLKNKVITSKGECEIDGIEINIIK